MRNTWYYITYFEEYIVMKNTSRFCRLILNIPVVNAMASDAAFFHLSAFYGSASTDLKWVR